MLAPPRKRPRSPSPDHDITSPLDVVLKRRRKRDYFDNIHSDEVDFGSEQHWSDSEVSSHIPKFVEKRRTRQWEKQNAPLPPYHLPGLNPFGTRPALGESRSQPEISTSTPQYPVNHFSNLSPLPRLPFAQSQSQPDPSKLPMSSSPIRHASPSSSPFRPTGSNRTNDTKVDDIDVDEYEPMDEEYMKREWGHEYAAQNSLLHSLHVSRAGPSSTRKEAPTPRSTATPDQTLLQTPVLPSPYAYPSYTHMTPGGPMQTSLSNYPADAHMKSSMSLQTSWHMPYPPGPTPYRNGPQFSSPGTAPTLHTTPSTGIQDGADGMDIEYPMAVPDQTPGGRASYEEANRLLAALAFDRRKRWGEEVGEQ